MMSLLTASFDWKTFAGKLFINGRLTKKAGSKNHLSQYICIYYLVIKAFYICRKFSFVPSGFSYARGALRNVKLHVEPLRWCEAAEFKLVGKFKTGVTSDCRNRFWVRSGKDKTVRFLFQRNIFEVWLWYVLDCFGALWGLLSWLAHWRFYKACFFREFSLHIALGCTLPAPQLSCFNKVFYNFFLFFVLIDTLTYTWDLGKIFTRGPSHNTSFWLS